MVGPAKSPEKDAIIKMLQTRFIPNKSLAYTPPGRASSLPVLANKVTAEGQTTVYVCENNICKYPTGDIAKIQELVDDNKRYKLD